MKYSKRRLAHIFLDWPAFKDSENLDMVIERIDVLEAITRLEGISYDAAEEAMDRAWNQVRAMGMLNLVAGAVSFADNMVREVNR